jgi:outer membrane protein assembly factor BamB
MDCPRRLPPVLLVLVMTVVLIGRLFADRSDAFQINAAHTGGIENGSFTPNFTAAWTADFGGAINYPVIAGGKVFLSIGGATAGSDAYGSRLYALDLNTGAVLWGPIALPGVYFSNYLAYDNGRLFAVDFDGLLKAVNPDTGSILWSREVGYFCSAPTAYHGVVYVGGANSLQAINETTGGVIWSRSLNGDGYQSSPTVTADGVYVAYAADNIYKLSLVNGSSIWAYPPDGDGGGADTAPVYQGRVYTGAFSGNLILDAATGKAAIRVPVPSLWRQSNVPLEWGHF